MIEDAEIEKFVGDLNKVKTLGQIAHEALINFYVEHGWELGFDARWQDLHEEQKAAKECAAQAVAARVIEKCAQRLEQLAEDEADASFIVAAFAIRAMNEASHE